MKHLIVSRHPATIAYIREMLPEFSAAKVIENATAEDVRGYAIAGNLPNQLACLADSVITVEFRGAAPRGAEYGRAELEAAGVHFTEYVVMTKERYVLLDECAQRGYEYL